MQTRERRPGKPLRMVLVLALILALSMAGVTLGLYVKEVKLFGDGWIGPKYYAFEVDNSVTDQSIAPGQSVEYTFTVSNHNAGGVAQVPIQVSIEATYPTSLADTGNILAQLYRGSDLLAESGSGSLSCAGAVLPENTSTTHSYTLKLTWQNADIVHLGDVKFASFDASQISIRVSGYQ
ncbi:MAG: hypothetical protein GX418_13380 [Clostridiales bacterium]|nr:hypothetical protein [Clostridiales bacterium]